MKQWYRLDLVEDTVRGVNSPEPIYVFLRHSQNPELKLKHIRDKVDRFKSSSIKLLKCQKLSKEGEESLEAEIKDSDKINLKGAKNKWYWSERVYE